MSRAVSIDKHGLKRLCFVFPSRQEDAACFFPALMGNLLSLPIYHALEHAALGTSEIVHYSHRVTI